MAKYLPLHVSPDIKSSASDMIALHWRDCAIVADFAIPGDRKQVLRVEFARVDFIRVLDEFPLSTEEGTPNEGLVPEHFAYAVEDGHFWLTQSEAWRISSTEARHYQFVTGNSCLDVIANCRPTITVAAAEVC